MLRQMPSIHTAVALVSALTLAMTALLACGTAEPADPPPQEFTLAQPQAQESDATPVPTAEPDPQEDQPTPEPADSQESESQVEPENGGDYSEPTPDPTVGPTAVPTPEPEPEETPEPTDEPTPEPSLEPTPENTPQPTPEPTTEPTPEPTEQSDPTPTPSYACGNFPEGRICLEVYPRPTPKYPELGHLLSKAVQDLEEAEQAQRDGATGASTVIPNLKIIVFMEPGVLIDPVITYLRANNIPDVGDIGQPWRLSLEQNVPAIYEIARLRPHATYETVMAVVPANLIKPLSEMEGVEEVRDGRGYWVSIHP